MNKTFLLLVSAVLLLGIVSATSVDSLQGWLNDGQATNIALTISPHQTQVSFHLNTSNYPSLDDISSTINTPTGGMPISTTISSVLNGVNLQTSLNSALTYPTFSNVDLSTPVTVSPFGTHPLWYFIDLGLMFNNMNISFTGNTTTDTQILNKLASSPQNQLQTIQGNTVFTKTGDDYTITYNQGWQDANVQSGDYSQYVNQIQNIIQLYAGESFNIKDLVTNYIFPVSTIGDNVKTLLGSNLDKFDYTISGVELNNAINSLQQTYDLSSLTNLKDGTYNIPVVFTVNGVQVNKMISVTLSGVPIQQTYYEFANNACTLKTLFPVQVTANDYNTQNGCEANILTNHWRFSDNVCTQVSLTSSQVTSADYDSETACESNKITAEVNNQYVSGVKNLAYGAIITATILDTTQAINGTKLARYLSPLKVIEIDSTVQSSGDILFNIDKNLVSDKNRVSLYVLEGTSWTKLTTTYMNEDSTEYYYSAHTPHFSIFMIAEDTTPVTRGSGGGSGDGVAYVSSLPSSSGSNTGSLTPINTTNNNNQEKGTSAPITGGVIGFIKSGLGIATILGMMIIVIGAVIFFTVRRR